MHQQQQQSTQKRRAIVHQQRKIPFTKIETTNEQTLLNDFEVKKTEEENEKTIKSFLTGNLLNNIVEPIQQSKLDDVTLVNQNEDREEPFQQNLDVQTYLNYEIESATATTTATTMMTTATMTTTTTATTTTTTTTMTTATTTTTTTSTTTTTTTTTTATTTTTPTTTHISVTAAYLSIQEPVQLTTEEQIQILLVQKDQKNNLEITIPLSKIKMINNQEFLQHPLEFIRREPIQQNPFQKKVENDFSKLIGKPIQQSFVPKTFPFEKLRQENVFKSQYGTNREPFEQHLETKAIEDPFSHPNVISTLPSAETFEENFVFKTTEKSPIIKRERPKWGRKQPILLIQPNENAKQPFEQKYEFQNNVFAKSSPKIDNADQFGQTQLVEEGKEATNNDYSEIEEEGGPEDEETDVDDDNDIDEENSKDTEAENINEPENTFEEVQPELRETRLEDKSPSFKNKPSITFESPNDDQHDEEYEMIESVPEVKETIKRFDQLTLGQKQYKLSASKFSAYEKNQRKKEQSEGQNVANFNVKDVQIFDEVRSPSDINGLFNIETPVNVEPKKKFDSKSGKTFQDNFSNFFLNLPSAFIPFNSPVSSTLRLNSQQQIEKRKLKFGEKI